jgi:hypothetical protein
VRCAAGCCIKFVKKCISRARAPRGRDAWGYLIDIKTAYGTKLRAMLRAARYAGAAVPYAKFRHSRTRTPTAVDLH